MFGWFRKKREEPIVFDSSEAAFEYAWGSMNYQLLLESVIPAMVKERGDRGPEGEHCFLLRLALREGITTLWGCTLREADDFPEPGDFVGFRVVRIAPELPTEMSVIGYIAFKLDPVLVGNAWKIAKSYTPSNIKRPIRF